LPTNLALRSVFTPTDLDTAYHLSSECRISVKGYGYYAAYLDLRRQPYILGMRTAVKSFCLLAVRPGLIHLT